MKTLALKSFLKFLKMERFIRRGWYVRNVTGHILSLIQRIHFLGPSEIDCLLLVMMAISD